MTARIIDVHALPHSCRRHLRHMIQVMAGNILGRGAARLRRLVVPVPQRLAWPRGHETSEKVNMAISERTQTLIRKAWKSILADPASWDQAVVWENRSCGTQRCIGGWMMFHDGVTRVDNGFKDEFGQQVHAMDYFMAFISELYGRGKDGLHHTIFSGKERTLDEMKAEIEALGINLSEPVTEGHVDIEFGGADFDKVFEADIEHFVRLCNDAGDRMTVRTVKSDDILMTLLRNVRRHGRAEGKAETLASNDGVREAQHLLKIEQRKVAELAEALKEAQQSASRRVIDAEKRGRDEVMDKLQEFIDMDNVDADYRDYH